MSFGAVKGYNQSGDLVFARKSDGAKMLQLRASQLGPSLEGMVKTNYNSQNMIAAASEVLGGLLTHQSQTAGGTVTLPVGSALDAAIPGVATNDSFYAVYANVGNQTGTITAPDGTITLVGTLAVTTGKVATLLFFRTGTAAWTVYCQVG